MANLIQADYDALKSLEGKILAQGEAMEGLLRKLSSQTDLLAKGWTGDSATRFQREMQELVLPSLDRLQSALAGAGEGIRKVSAEMRSAEEAAAAVLSSDGASSWKSFLEGVHTGLDVVGFIPGWGEIADGVNAAIYAGEGRWVDAGISAAGMIPIFGETGKVGRLGVKLGKEVLGEAAERGAREVVDEGVQRGSREAAGSAGRGGRGAGPGSGSAPSGQLHPRTVSEAAMAREIYQAKRVPLGTIPPNRMPDPNLSSNRYGDEMEKLVKERVKEKFPDLDFSMSRRGVEGPDMVIQGGKKPGYDWIEIKPDTQSGVDKFLRQFSKSEKWEGRGRLVVYDRQGNIKMIDYEMWTE